MSSARNSANARLSVCPSRPYPWGCCQHRSGSNERPGRRLDTSRFGVAARDRPRTRSREGVRLVPQCGGRAPRSAVPSSVSSRRPRRPPACASMRGHGPQGRTQAPQGRARCAASAPRSTAAAAAPAAGHAAAPAPPAGAADPSATRGRDRPPRPAFGVFTDDAPYSGNVNAVDALQGTLGRDIDIVNWYQNWGGGDWVSQVPARASSARSPAPAARRC